MHELRAQIDKLFEIECLKRKITLAKSTQGVAKDITFQIIKALLSESFKDSANDQSTTDTEIDVLDLCDEDIILRGESEL